MARLAAFDMDGTLLLPDHHLGEATLNTLKRAGARSLAAVNAVTSPFWFHRNMSVRA